MKSLFLIPSVAKERPVAGSKDEQPLMDYLALMQAQEAAGWSPELLDYAAVESSQSPLIRLTRAVLDRDAALVLLGYLRSKECEAVFTNSESLGIPLSMFLKFTRRRPIHVMIGHRLSTGKKAPFFRFLRVERQMDRIFVYATQQLLHSVEKLGISKDRLSLIAFHADLRFFRPLPEIVPDPNQICSAGLEWRDYPTLIEAVRDTPELKVRLAAASPWSKHTNETEGRDLPPNVHAQRYSYAELRELYARSSIVVVPLYENDFQAGVTTILEAMAMGKPVIVTKTVGQTDVVRDGVNGLTVPPGDPKALADALQRLRSDASLRLRLGAEARRWVEENASLDLWVRNITDALMTPRQARKPSPGVAPMPSS